MTQELHESPRRNPPPDAAHAKCVPQYMRRDLFGDPCLIGHGLDNSLNGSNGHPHLVVLHKMVLDQPPDTTFHRLLRKKRRFYDERLQ